MGSTSTTRVRIHNQGTSTKFSRTNSCFISKGQNISCDINNEHFTRKNTSGVLMELLGVPVHFISKTQSVIAVFNRKGTLCNRFRSCKRASRSIVSHRSKTFKECHIGNPKRFFKCKEHCKAVRNFTKDTSH